MEKVENQEGVVEEQVAEETSKPASEATSTEEKATSEKQKDDDWKRTMQSRTDRAEHEARIAKEGLQKLQSQIEQERLANQKKQLDALADDPDAQRRLMEKFDLDAEKRKLYADIDKEYEGMSVAWQQAADLVARYGLLPSDVPELVKIKSPEHMEDRAARIAAEAKLKAKEQAKIPIPEKEKTGFPKPDSATSDAGGDSDEAFLKAWNAGDIPATKENLARANKIINK